MTDNNGLYPIGVVERDTGIGRDTLRVWERRYGFPQPIRNEKGERIYPEKQLRHLQRIRRLLDQGLRPGKLVPLGEDGLDELESGLLHQQQQDLDETVAAVLKAVQSTDSGQLELVFRQQYTIQGMQGFILKTVVPLLKAVGEHWVSGKLQIYQEHFLSQQLIRFLNAEIVSMQIHARKPRVLLATLPGEEHTLGLLMVAAMLSCHGISVINIGGEVPMDQIVAAAEQFRADIVGITFSGAYQYSNIRTHLSELRELLPEDVDIWTGGEGVRRQRKLPLGITKFNTLEKLPV